MSRLRMLTLGQRALLAALGLFVLLAVLGPVVWGHRATQLDVLALDQGASSAHPFGTDGLGRDLFARTMVATRLSLVVAAVTTLLGFGIGVVAGMVPLLLGPRARRAVEGTIGLLVAFPSILLVLLVVAIVGPGVKGTIIALGIAAAPPAARLTQTLAAAVGDSDYVAAARLVGVRPGRLLRRHVLPNVASPLSLQLAQAMSAALLASSALSFLGIGVQEPDYDWGSLLNVGLDRIYVVPAAALGPAAVIILASLVLNAAGNALAVALAGERPAHGRRAAGDAGTVPVPEAAHAVAGDGADDAVLRVTDVSVRFPSAHGSVQPVRGVSLAVGAGERLGIVGESGSGKSLTALAVAGLVEHGTVEAAAIEIDGTELRTLSRAERDRLLGTSMAMVFQDPLGALNPVRRNGRQIVEAARAHLGMERDRALAGAAARLRELGISAAERRLTQYPHELSGGMRQRAVLAMGLMTEPRLIIADEPTTALDVTVQRHVLAALRQVNEEHGTAIVLISHDMSVIRSFCERVLVMYGGIVVEEVDADRLDRAAHPYTRALLAAVPDMATDRDRPLATIPGRAVAAEDAPDGCPFAPRCAYATDRCRAERPALVPRGTPQPVACWHPQAMTAELSQEAR